MFFIQQNQEQEGRTGSAWRWGRGKVAQIYTHISKNDKTKF
jgi:hypothetical protein